MYQRELLGELARRAHETIKELMSETAGDNKAPSRRCRRTAVHLEVF